MARYSDGPWAMPRMARLVPGDRTSPRQSRRRTKGARKTKTYRESGRPDALGLDNVYDMIPGNARERRKIRRAMERAARRAADGVTVKVAPPLKTRRPAYSGGHIATEYSEMVHQGMRPVQDSERHMKMHEKQGRGIRKGCK